MSFILAQILGVLVIVAFAAAPHMKTKPLVLFCFMLGNALTVVEFLLLGAMTEAAVLFVSLIRSAAFSLYSRKDAEKRAPVWLLVLFMFLQAGAVFVTWKSWICLLMLFDIGQTYGQWQHNLKVLRYCVVITCLPIGLYNLLVGGYTSAVSDVIQIVSAGAALWHRHYRKAVR